jgi:hypothetical protein
MRLSNLPVRAFAKNFERPTCLSRITAGLGVFLVLLLAWLAADPSAHRALHADEHAGCAHAHGGDHGHGTDDAVPGDYGCVVAKFAHGQVEVFTAPVVVVAPSDVRVTVSVRSDERAISVASHLFPPGRGPPAA